MTTPNTKKVLRSERKQIPSAVRLRELFSYNPETGILVFKERPAESFATENAYGTWTAKFAGKAAGGLDSNGYIECRINNRSYKVHRLIWKIVHGVEPDCIDHINGNRSDNRLCNLRNVSMADNQRNAKRRKDNKTGVSGVRQCLRTRRWLAAIRVAGKIRWIGAFTTFEEAVAARQLAERQYGFHENHGRSGSMIQAGRITA